MADASGEDNLEAADPAASAPSADKEGRWLTSGVLAVGGASLFPTRATKW